MTLAQKVLGETPDQFKNIVDKLHHFSSKYDALRQGATLADKDGLWAEFGVYSGETLNILTEYNLPVYGFDSFEGLPEHWNHENEQGKFNTNGQPIFEVTDKMKLVVGWFNESLPKFINENQINKVSLLHLDADLYSSTKCVFDNLKPYFKGKCILVFDEFINYPGWEQHEYKAFYEFINEMESQITNVELLSYSTSIYNPLVAKVEFK